jgi:hypothetical protein
MGSVDTGFSAADAAPRAIGRAVCSRRAPSFIKVSGSLPTGVAPRDSDNAAMRTRFAEYSSAGNDRHSLAAAGSQAVNIVRVARENPVSGTGTTVASMGSSVRAFARSVPASRPICSSTGRTFGRPQESGDNRLLASRAAPYMGDHNRAGAQFVTVELGDT